MIIDAPQQNHLPLLRNLFQQAFDESADFLDIFYQVAFHPDRCRCAIIEGQLAAALYWFDCEYRGTRIAYLYAIATDQNFRGRGICHSLMKNTHAHLVSLGYQGALLVPASQSLFAFYQGMGYQPCCPIRTWECSALTQSADVRRVNASEYAALRRQLLPPDSVIQENESLDLLQATAQLFAGNDFLAAVTKQANTLFVSEFLGNEALAPALVAALGCSKGKFHTTGTERPFTMFLPFVNSPLPPPSYFGLAFD